MVPFVEVIAPYDQTKRHGDFLYAPPQPRAPVPRGPVRRPVRLSLQLHVRPRDASGATTSSTARSRSRCASSAAATRYEFWGLVRPTFHLVCPPENGTMFLLGTDRLGRDLLLAHHLRRPDLAHRRPRRHRGLVHRSACSSAASPAISAAGSTTSIQRLIEILRSLPELPLWLALSAALPPNWSPILVFFGITHDPRPARLAGPRPRGALEAAVAARGGFRAGRRADGRLDAAHHRPPPDPELHEPPDRLGDAVDPVDDPRRDRPLLPRASACARR